MLNSFRGIFSYFIFTGIVIVLTGIFDDIKPVDAKIKLVLQIIAACIVVFYGEIVLSHIDVFGINMDFPVPLNYIITIIFIVNGILSYYPINLQ